MADTRRNQLKTFVEREFIGPDPIDWEGTKQENGEEILSADAPSTRYIAGILFPGMVSEDSGRDGHSRATRNSRNNRYCYRRITSKFRN